MAIPVSEHDKHFFDLLSHKNQTVDSSSLDSHFTSYFVSESTNLPHPTDENSYWQESEHLFYKPFSTVNYQYYYESFPQVEQSDSHSLYYMTASMMGVLYPYSQYLENFYY